MRHDILVGGGARVSVSLALFPIFNNKRIVRQVFNEERNCLISHAATVLCCGYVLSCNHTSWVCACDRLSDSLAMRFKPIALASRKQNPVSIRERDKEKIYAYISTYTKESPTQE